ncbi:MAG: tetratricopeptide repeat protein [Minicystis sp.]
MRDDDVKRPTPGAGGGRVLSIAERIEQKQRDRLRAQAAKLHIRELETTVAWLDMTKDLEAIDLDADLAALAQNDTAEARRQRGELRCLRALRHCLHGEVDAGYAEWTEAAAEAPDLALPHLLRARWQMSTEPREALAHFDRAAELAPRDANVYFRRGDCHAKLGDLEHALANYRRALALDPTSIDGLHTMGKTLVALGRPAEALRYYDQAIALAPRYVDFHASRAIALEVLDEHAAAVRDYDRILELDPSHVVARFSRARCRAETGEMERATSELEALAESQPDAPEIPRLLGKLFLRMERWDAAIAAFTRALTLAPDDDEALGQRALALMRAGDKGRALEDTTRALALAPSAQQYVYLDIFLRHEGRDADAIVALDEAIARLPDAALLIQDRAKRHAKIGDHARALADWDALLASYPGDLDCRLGRARALGMLERREEAMEEASRVIDGDPTNAMAYALRANYRDNLEGDEALIAADWERAITLGPNDIAILYYHGQYLLQRGAYERATADFDHLLALAPRFAEAYYLRAMCRYRIDEERTDIDEDWEPDPAVTAERCRLGVVDLERALELGYRDADVYLELYWQHRELGDLVAGRAVLDRGIDAYPDIGLLFKLRQQVRQELGDPSGAEADRLRAREILGPDF